MVPLERLQIGRRAVGLTVDVQAPPWSNYQETKLRDRSQEQSVDRRSRVVVRDELPAVLSFVSSQPPPDDTRGQMLTWELGTLAANSERPLIVIAKPTQTGSFDHGATVTMSAGGKSRTLVQEPKLKVEQTVKNSKVLKGGQAEFDIVVSNPGTGPARNVVVQAKLSQGLHHEQGDHIEQKFDVIEPGKPIQLDPLIADAKSGGDQSCVVTASSPDVVEPRVEALSRVTVVEPKLELKMTGPPRTLHRHRGHVQVDAEESWNDSG